MLQSQVLCIAVGGRLATALPVCPVLLLICSAVRAHSTAFFSGLTPQAQMMVKAICVLWACPSPYHKALRCPGGLLKSSFSPVPLQYLKSGDVKLKSLARHQKGPAW